MGRLNTCILITAIWTLANGHAVLGQTESATAQSIPGRVQCEWYASGGEGVAYHDQDSVNNGSGKLNPADGSFLNEFRMREGVDISYTKSKGSTTHHLTRLRQKWVSFMWVGPPWANGSKFE